MKKFVIGTIYVGSLIVFAKVCYEVGKRKQETDLTLENLYRAKANLLVNGVIADNIDYDKLSLINDEIRKLELERNA